MLQLENHTPFCANITLIPDERAIDHLVVTVKGTFSIIGKGIEVSEQQVDLVEADEFWGEPGQSSLKYASEIHLPKVATDIVVVGEACAPDENPVTSLVVAAAVADRLKTIRVFGDRQWESGLTGLKPSAPKPYVRMPLVYERAFGGTIESGPDRKRIIAEPRNPVGVGLNAKRKASEIKGTPLPNLEQPRKRIRHSGDSPGPTCFGYVAPSWTPRRQYAGTYDAHWLKTRAPFLPVDFDARFFNAAPAELICRGYLRGGEPVHLVNLSPAGPLRFHLPVCDIAVKVSLAGELSTPRLNIETVILEPCQSRFSLLWRAKAPCDKKSLKVENVVLKLNQIEF
jgi:hypothetical protein